MSTTHRDTKNYYFLIIKWLVREYLRRYRLSNYCKLTLRKVTGSNVIVYDLIVIIMWLLVGMLKYLSSQVPYSSISWVGTNIN